MKRFIYSLIAFVLFLFVATPALASEGLVELRNRVGDDARCFAASILMPDQNYSIVVSCRDILYPGGTEIFHYVVWETPLNGGNAIRLGTLNLGKVEFKTKNAFTSLYVTKEKSTNPNSPSGEIIMQGSLRPIALLETKKLNTPETTPGTNQPEIVPPSPGEEMESPVPTSAPQTGVAKFLTGGILAIFGIAGIIFLLFIITKK